MARIRTIKPEFPQSESMGRVSRDARLCFIMLWTIADDAGRLRGNSRMLASLLFPYDDDAKKLIDKWLGELEREKCVIRYEIEGDAYLQINGWAKHQKIDKPSASKISPPPAIREDSRGLSKPRERSSEDQGRDQGEDQGGEGKGRSAEPQSDSTPPPTLLVIPLVDDSDFPVTAQQVEEWAVAYPGVDVAQQLREMRQWCIANPANRKTPRGILRFITTWLGKEQDRSTPRAPSASGPQWLQDRQAKAAEFLRPLTGGRAPVRQDPSNVIDLEAPNARLTLG